MIIFAIMAAAFAGCSKGTGGTGNTPQPFVPETAPNGALIIYSENQFYIQVGEKRIYSGGTAEQLLKDLEAAGQKPLSVDEAESCLFEGKDVTYHFSFGDVFTFPAEDGSGNIVDEIYVTGKGAASMGGIKVGDPKYYVTAVFGGAYFNNGENMMVYTASGDPARKDVEKQLYFYIEDGVVTGIGLLENLYHAEA